MKSQIKTVVLSTIFSIMGLCCTLSTASAESNGAKIHQYISINTYSSSFPLLANEGSAKDKQLLKPDNGLTEFTTCETTTKNEYFELAIIFNDKLQQLISVLFVDDISNANDTQLNQLSKLD
jgi:hypothetical protein